MTDPADRPLWSAARDALLRELLRDSDIEARMSSPQYREAFRLRIGDELHSRFDFSQTTQSPEVIADRLLNTVLDVARHYRTPPKR